MTHPELSLLKGALKKSLDDIEEWLERNVPAGSSPHESAASLNWLCMRLANWADELNSLKAEFMFLDPAAYAQAHRQWKAILRVRKKLLHATIRQQDDDLDAAMRRFTAAAIGIDRIIAETEDDLARLRKTARGVNYAAQVGSALYAVIRALA